MAKAIAVFRLTGIRPLLCHNPASMRRSEDKLGKKEIPSPEVEAKAGLYLDGKGRIVFPSMAVRNCMISAASKSKMKFGKTSATNVLSASIFPVEEFVPILDPNAWEQITTYAIDMRRAVVQRQGIIRARPKFDAWGMDVPFECDDSYANNIQEGAAQILNIGGGINGIGDFRIEKKGLFGQFRAELRK